MTQIQLFWSYWGLMPHSLNGVLHRFYQYFSHITATIHIIHAFLGFTSTKLGSEVSCPRTLTRKNPEDPVRLEPRNPGLRVKHFTTEPRGTLMTLSTVKVISWQSVTHMCFLAFSHQYIHNYSFQSHLLLFSHASAEVRGENTQERKLA